MYNHNHIVKKGSKNGHGMTLEGPSVVEGHELACHVPLLARHQRQDRVHNLRREVFGITPDTPRKVAG